MLFRERGGKPMALTATQLRSVSAVRSIADEWQRLHESSGDVNPFSGPDWALTWLEHFAALGDRETLVVVVRDGADLVGVAPFTRQRPFLKAASVILPVGSGTPWIGPFELPAFCVSPGRGRDVARAVVDSLGSVTGEWDWANVMFGSEVPWFEPEWLPDWNHTVLVKGVRAAAVLELGADVDIYAGKRNLKESFRRAKNRLTRDFGADGWAVRRVTDLADVPAAVDRLFDLHGRRASLDNGQPIHLDVLADRPVRAFLKDALTRMAGHERLSVYELLVGDQVMASQLILHTRTASYSSISGATDEIWPYSAVTYLQSRAVADAQQDGHVRMCLSIGPNQAKMRWTDRVEVHTEFAVVGPHRRSRGLYLLTAGKGLLSSYVAERRAHRV